MTKLIMQTVFLMVAGFSLNAQAQDVVDEKTNAESYNHDLSSFTVEGLKDQFEQPVTLNENTQWVVFISEKSVSQIFSDSMKTLNINPDHQPFIYVSDISKMPALITKMFALPKMKKLGYKMALDRSGEITKSWPRQDKSVTILSIKDKAVNGVDYLEDEDQILAFLSQFK